MSAAVVALVFRDKSGSARRTVQIEHLVVAGWTGRDKAAVEKHIAELEAIGVKRPATTPIFYRASAVRVTTDDAIEALGNASSGEAEFVLLQHGGRLWVGTGSDHTDREVEKYGVSVSKQMCDKPIAKDFWAYDEIAPHWDRLILRAYFRERRAQALPGRRGNGDARSAGADRAICRQGRSCRRNADVLRHAGRAWRRARRGCF